MAVNPFWQFTDVCVPLPSLPGELFPFTIPQVQQQTDSAQPDDAGVAVPTWAVIYTNLVAGVELFGYEGMQDWAQRGVISSGTVWFPPQVELGALPTNITNRCRIQFGNLSDGVTPRWLTVRWARDEADAGLLWTVRVDELFTGGH